MNLTIEAQKNPEFVHLIDSYLKRYNGPIVDEQEKKVIRARMNDSIEFGELAARGNTTFDEHIVIEKSKLSTEEKLIIDSSPLYFHYIYSTINFPGDLLPYFKNFDQRTEMHGLFGHSDKKEYPTFLYDLLEIIRIKDDFEMTDVHRDLMWELFQVAGNPNTGGGSGGGKKELTSEYVTQRANNRGKPRLSEA